MQRHHRHHHRRRHLPRHHRHPHHHRRHHQWLCASLAHTSCSSNGISRISRQKRRRCLMVQCRLMAIAVRPRSCLPVTPIFRVRLSTTSPSQHGVTLRSRTTSSARVFQLALSRAKRSARQTHGFQQPTVFVSFKTVGWKSPTARVRVTKPFDLARLIVREPVERPAPLLCAGSVACGWFWTGA